MSVEHQALGKGVLELGIEPRAFDGILDKRQGFEQAARAKAAAMRNEGALAFEMRTGPELTHRLLYRPARGLHRGDAIEVGEMPAERRESGLRVGAAGRKSVQFAQRPIGVTAAHLVDEFLHRDLGAIANHGVDVLFADAALAGGVQRKLGDLGTRQRLVGAEMGSEISATTPNQFKAGARQLLIDQIGNGALVAVARDRRRSGVTFEQFAQGLVGSDTPASMTASTRAVLEHVLSAGHRAGRRR